MSVDLLISDTRNGPSIGVKVHSQDCWAFTLLKMRFDLRNILLGQARPPIAFDRWPSLFLIHRHDNLGPYRANDGGFTSDLAPCLALTLQGAPLPSSD